ncbi:MAG TPA: hypothetical protein VFG38_21400 [Pseudomonadales bacterium]|nr:hypothetical protein [Pseudomonadales bacterium]
MTLDATFCYTRLKAHDRNYQPVLDDVRSVALPALAPTGITRWGAWSGLFGIGSNEIVLMTASAAAVDHAGILNARLATAPGAIVEQHVLRPTVRPHDVAPLARPGLYVFRFFDVRHADVDEIARLSFDAWTTFETNVAYRAEPQGLFCQRDTRAPTGVMLLCTWYDGLESWQASRTPAPAATENFRRRHALTSGTIAYATRLIEWNEAPGARIS